MSSNAVMAELGEHPDIPDFVMFTEVFQDSLVDLMEQGRLLGASSTALTLTEPLIQRVYDNFDFFGPRIVLRPQELSNNPGVIRRFGVITINTALEVDIYGHANSTHVAGTHMMNGIGGSGDFTRNSYLSIFMCPSVAKGGRISAIVPMASHVDHNEHSVQVVVTDQGLADLRGLGPAARAERIIDNCAHPAYRPYLHHVPRTLPRRPHPPRPGDVLRAAPEPARDRADAARGGCEGHGVSTCARAGWNAPARLNADDAAL